ncbi:N-acetylmuramoyl-L-alanine amidase [Leptospira fainei serovar Hurstbridge str. BUT 6]|uniref:N-acetylmuramoyl-L-alanine amidase n=1 Tax=Leptospira fainei serovar Hurstbridge str. BUT 6 TaxID=1193011 RepID=S3VEZ5_9LEPT|nr:peptidoglycan recognition family protein [Leptospira fainei]EPG75040.1 N-acetylmuramoyl-L-alanine amidase [Leptospira fainei serovar Hurstbridge str. BUT 6]
MLNRRYAFILAILFYQCASEQSIDPQPAGPSVSESVVPIKTFLPSAERFGDLVLNRWNIRTKGILLHHTRGLGPEEYIRKSITGGWLVHYLVDRNGKIYGVEEAGKIQVKAAPKMDENVIHIAWEGNREDVLKRSSQKKALFNLIRKLAKEYKISFTNYDIDSRNGIFTHTQAKKRFGRFLDGGDCGNENVVKALLEESGGKYYSEPEWKDRFGPDWVLRKERPFSGPTGEPQEPTYDKGRGVTPAPKAELESIEKTKDGLLPEERRLRYNYRGAITADCVVLHFTAIPDYNLTLKVLEKRNLSATFLADKDGKVYQLLDHHLHMAAAATGTNRNCFQVEIVGKDTEMLLANPLQSEAVAKLVKELSQKYNFPLDNKAIELLKGVYSHTQAKKKWGGSIFLDAQDFDPGEPYMKKILDLVGGKFYSEKDWQDRNSDNWILLFTEFQP